MKKIVLTYGLISSVIIAAMIGINTTFRQQIGFDNAMLFGYASMILGLSMIYFAIASFKKNNGGEVSFGKAFRIGLYISLIASAAYALIWVILMNTVMPDFCAEYGRYTIDKMQQQGASPQKIAAAMDEMKTMSDIMKNPILLFLEAMLVECLPVGLLLSLIAAAILRTKKKRVVL